jgi:hypothetical protein
VREFGVFIYEINGIFHYEDFERRPSMFGFPIRAGKHQKPYVKMEGSFTPDMIESLSLVTKSQALSCAQGYRTSTDDQPCDRSQETVQPACHPVVLKDGPTLSLNSSTKRNSSRL